MESLSAAERLATPLPIVVRDREADGLFRLRASRGGRSIELVVDTGATVTVLSAADARHLALDIDHGEASEMTTAGGVVPIRYVTLDRLDVAGRGVSPLYVAVAASGLPHSLLGQDALTQLGRITLEGDRIEIGGGPARD